MRAKLDGTQVKYEELLYSREVDGMGGGEEGRDIFGGMKKMRRDSNVSQASGKSFDSGNHRRGRGGGGGGGGGGGDEVSNRLINNLKNNKEGGGEGGGKGKVEEGHNNKSNVKDDLIHQLEISTQLLGQILRAEGVGQQGQREAQEKTTKEAEAAAFTPMKLLNTPPKNINRPWGGASFDATSLNSALEEGKGGLEDEDEGGGFRRGEISLGGGGGRGGRGRG